MDSPGCSYCCGNQLCDNDECDVCYKKSFASHPKADWWSPKNKLTARQVYIDSDKKFFLICKKCNHEIEKRLRALKNSGCSYCAHYTLCNDTKCTMCKNNSFESHVKSKYWSNKNKIKPRQTFRSSANQYWFDCNKCNHSFKMSPHQIVNNNNWCTYCASYKLCDNDDCNFCFNKSFASHPKSVYLSSKNKIDARQIFKYSCIKYLFDCDVCNKSFKAAISNVTSRNSWCPYHINKTEKILLDWLESTYKKYTIVYQPKFDWCKSKNTEKYYPFDFLIKELGLIIENDGLGHFKQVANWTPPDVALKRDIYKMKLAVSKGYSVIRILQEDIFYNKNNWETRLKKSIKKYEEPAIIYLCNKDEYKNHKKGTIEI
jgi:very-short-patch-repair endonuclease